jgi:RNA polymerase sigma-70 factor (ECF subfamily)
LARWLEAARGGSAEALGRLLEGCRRYLLLVANRQLGPELQAKGGASDLVQETFLNAQQHFDGFHGHTEGELLAWLRCILLNQLANFARRYQGTGKRRADREVSIDTDSAADGLREHLRTDSISPSGHARRHEQAELLEQALARLPEVVRQVIRWRHQEQMSFEEIGMHLNRSPEAARKLWARAIQQLRQVLGPPHER